MGKHERIKDEPKPETAEEAAQSAPATEADAAVIPKMALASVEAPKVEMPAIEASAIELPKIEPPAIELPKIEAAIIDPPKIELASIEAPHIAPDLGESTPPAADDTAQYADTEHPAAETPAAGIASRIFTRFNMLAASLALAAAFGGMVGALAAYSFTRPVAAPAVVAARSNLEQIQALKESVVQARVDLAAMKVVIDAGNRAAAAQLTRIGERIDRIERVQAEPAAKLNKAIETLDRLSRADAGAQKEVTGSIMPPPPAGAAASPGGLDGWVVREVHRGTALLEGRMGLIEVDKGDVVPGLGRIEAIRKQDGRWVVVTTKGLIMSAR